MLQAALVRQALYLFAGQLRSPGQGPLCGDAFGCVAHFLAYEVRGIPGDGPIGGYLASEYSYQSIELVNLCVVDQLVASRRVRGGSSGFKSQRPQAGVSIVNIIDLNIGVCKVQAVQDIVDVGCGSIYGIEVLRIVRVGGADQ